jgi:hypothetical protein
MAASYKIDKDRRLVCSTWSGVLTADEVLAQQRQLVNDPDFDPSFSQYSDFTGVRAVDLNAVNGLVTAILARWCSQTTSSPGMSGYDVSRAEKPAPTETS